MSLKKIGSKRGFTIVELVVVIVVIGILTTITVVAYGGWQSSIISTKVKNDVAAAAAAMENSVTFNNAYPSSIPTTVATSPGVTLTLSSDSDAQKYCIDGTSTEDATVQFYISSEQKDKGAQEGLCANRPDESVPSTPDNLAVINQASTFVELTWSESSNSPTSYTAQCATDAGFVNGVKNSTQSDTTTTVTGLSATTTHFCRVRAENASGLSSWSATISTDTTDHSCADTNQYGTYPTCYAYDALPVATSIEGYWTSAPDGFLLEDGSAVSRTTYADLFAAIGTTYGAGNGSTTFNLPDSRGRTSVNRNTADAEFAAVGQVTGSDTEVLTVAQMPSHSHLMGWLGSGSNVSDYLGGSGASYGLSTTYSVRGGSYDVMEHVGGSQAHNNIQPSIVKVSAIKYRPTTGNQSTLPPGTSIEGYWSSAPSGYLLENGAAVSRTTYSALFSVLGTAHGSGNGTTTFNLPDSRGRASVNLSSTDTEFDVIGEKPGSKTEQLTIAQIPAHTHRMGWIDNGSNISDYLAGSGASYGLTSSYSSRSGTYDMLESAGGNETHNNIQRSIVKTYAVKYTAASGTNDAVAKGTSIEGYWSTVPSGYLLEDGSAVSRTTYAGLFAVIGTTYGAGNGSTTFNLPDSRGRLGVNKDPADTNFDQLNEKTGEKEHTLTIAEMPSHTHQVGWLGSGSDVSDYLGGSSAAYGISLTFDSAGGAYSPAETVGGGQPHNNIMPSIVKLFAIKY